MAKETRYLIKIIATQQGVRQVKKTLKDVGGVVKTTSGKLKEGTKKMGDFQKALRRVMIVVPVWFIFRQAMMAVFQTLREGIKHWEDFERAMIKASQVIHGATTDMRTTIANLRKDIKDLSQESGKDMATLTETFYKFGTSGIAVERAQEGMREATKLSIIMQGDSIKTAEMLARTYRLLGDSMDKTIPEHQRMATIGAIIRKMWTSNIFELNGFNDSMERFMTTAKVYNIRMDETIALMATLNTASIKNSRAGRLMSSSLDRMMGNLDKVATMFNIKYNPAVDDAFGILMKVLGAIKELEKRGAGAKIISEAFEVFGGVRMRRPGKALVAIYDVLLKNQKESNIEQGRFLELIQETAKAYEDVQKTMPIQLDILRQSRKLVGQVFIQGIVGGKEFEESLARINDLMKAIESTAGYMGKRIKEAFKFSIPGLTELMYLMGKLKKWGKEVEGLDIKVPKIEGDVKGGVKTGKGLGADKTPDIIRFRTKEMIANMKSLIRHELDLLKIRGASASAIAKTKILLEDKFDIETGAVSQLKKKLSLEKAIAQEKIKQNKYSSDMVRLYKIAMKYGMDVARDVSRAITGKMPIEHLEKRPERAFEEFFPKRREQFQAGEFFERGEGRGIREIVQPRINIRDLQRNIEPPQMSQEQRKLIAAWQKIAEEMRIAEKTRKEKLIEEKKLKVIVEVKGGKAKDFIDVTTSENLKNPKSKTAQADIENIENH